MYGGKNLRGLSHNSNALYIDRSRCNERDKFALHKSRKSLISGKRGSSMFRPFRILDDNVKCPHYVPRDRYGIHFCPFCRVFFIPCRLSHRNRQTAISPGNSSETVITKRVDGDYPNTPAFN